MNLETYCDYAGFCSIYDSRNFNELGNRLCLGYYDPIYDSRNFNELGN